MNFDNPYNAPSLFARLTNTVTEQQEYVPVTAPIPAYTKLTRVQVFNELQRKMCLDTSRHGMLKQTPTDRQASLASVKAVMDYYALRESQLTVEFTNHDQLLTVLYPSGLVINAHSLLSEKGADLVVSHCNNLVKLGSIVYTHVYHVSHHQWPTMDLTSLIGDWKGFNHCLSEDVSRFLIPWGIRARFGVDGITAHPSVEIA